MLRKFGRKVLTYCTVYASCKIIKKMLYTCILVKYSFPSPVSRTPQKKASSKPEAFQYMVQEQGKSTTQTVKFKMLR